MLTHRNLLAIQQYAKVNGFSDRVEEVFNALQNILPMLGKQSHSRQMINSIGAVMLHDNVTVIAPSCPDYSHKDGIYTFESVRRSIPLLAQLHIKLLGSLETYIPRLKCEIVVADQEADDEALCARIRMSREEFKDCIRASVKATREYISGKSWRVSEMTHLLPDLLEISSKFSQEIRQNISLAQRIELDTIKREKMYLKIGVRDLESMRERTIRTAAQYWALGYIASRDKFLICNHETVNLSWYNRSGAGVLHNAVSIY